MIYFQRRKDKIEELKKIGWDKFISHSYPTSLAPRYLYNEARCCMDFGSTHVVTPLFPRTCEIVKAGGLLISGKSADQTELVEENQFKTGEQMLEVIEETFDPVKRNDKLEKQKSLYSKYSFDRIINNVFEQTQEIITQN